MTNRSLSLFISLTAAIMLFAAVSLANAATGSINKKFDESWNLIIKNFVREIPNTPQAKMECFEKTLRGGISDCLDDPHSHYLIPEDTERLYTEIKGEFGGIGLEMAFFQNKIIIIGVIDDTPAAKSGKFKNGDIIVEIDGENVEKKTSSYVVTKIRGIIGTPVTIVCKRNNKKQNPITVIREKIIIKSVVAEDIDPNTTLIKIENFESTDTPYQFFDEINSRLSLYDGTQHLDFNKKKFVIDLRNNPGGLLEMVQLMGSFFSDNPDDIIVTMRTRETEQIEHVEDIGRFPYKGVFKDLKFAILINGYSASAAEIFAGLMRDWGKVKLVGTKTFGKGSVQTVYRLSGNNSLALTMSEYFIGNSQMKVNGVGIEPDKWVENPEPCKKDVNTPVKPKLVDLENDIQLKEALKILKDL